MKNLLLRFIILSVVIIFAAETMQAIPAFARKYRMSCQTCHAPIPKLKPYGDEFAGNGFVLADQDAPRYYVDTGDPELSLIRDWPIAARLEAHVTYNNGNTEQPDFGTPYLLKLLSGGELAPNIAYYFYFYMNERGDVAGVEDAYLMFNNLFGSELDIYIGQFQVSDPLFKRELRLTLEDYHLYKQRVGNATANLAYDRGIMLTYGFETGTDIIVEVINGNGLGGADAVHNFDKDEYKNVFGRISQDITDFLRVGAFGYIGKEAVSSNANTEIQENNITMFGPDASINVGDKLELNLQYLQRMDSDTYQYSSSPTPNSDVESKGAMAELIFMPNGDDSDWYAVGMYNWFDSDFANLKYETISGHLGYVLRRNLRLVAEYTHNLTNEFGRYSIGFVSAF